jgi:pimeloyl-ACP methyl ester carboxylesterase
MAARPRPRPAVFVHGHCCSPRHWAQAPERLADVTEVSLLALPGHGRTPLPPDGALDFARCVEYILSHVGALGRPEVVLTGHSLGGMLALECVHRRPEAFSALVLVDAFPKLALPPPFDRSFWAGTPPPLKSRLLREMRDTRRRLPDSLWASIVAFDGRPFLPQLQVPLRAIYGDRGEGDHASLEKRLLELGLGEAADVEVHLIPQAGHFVMLEQPDEFYRRLAAILARLPSR